MNSSREVSIFSIVQPDEKLLVWLKLGVALRENRDGLTGGVGRKSQGSSRGRVIVIGDRGAVVDCRVIYGNFLTAGLAEIDRK